MIRFVVASWIRQYVIEYIDSLVYVLKDATVHVYSNNDELNNIMLLDGLHVFLQSAPEHITKHIYVINIEVAFREEVRCGIIKDAILKRGLCDYGANNISIMKKHLPYPLDIHYLPYQFNPIEVRLLEKTMDCVFVGGTRGWDRCSGGRTINLVDKIPNITVIGGEPDNHKYGEERDDILFRHKVLINAHARPGWSTHSVVRTFRCVFNKMIVVTEKSDDDDTNHLRNHMIIVDYEDIPKTVENVLANYSEYYNRLFETPEFEKAKEALKLPVLEFKRIIGSF